MYYTCQPGTREVKSDVQIDKSSRFILQEINHFHLSIYLEIGPQFLFGKEVKVLDSADIDISSSSRLDYTAP